MDGVLADVYTRLFDLYETANGVRKSVNGYSRASGGRSFSGSEEMGGCQGIFQRPSGYAGKQRSAGEA